MSSRIPPTPPAPDDSSSGQGLCGLSMALSPAPQQDLPHSSCSVSTGHIEVESHSGTRSSGISSRTMVAFDTCHLCFSSAPLSPSTSCLAALTSSFCLSLSPSYPLFFPSHLFALPFSSAFSFSSFPLLYLLPLSR